MLKENIKTDWIKALRSGKYQQADGMLRTREKRGTQAYCCLGVLCDVLGAEWTDNTPHIGRRRLEADEEAILSTYGLELSGLDQESQAILAQMNDDGYTFGDIANHIEKEL